MVSGLPISPERHYEGDFLIVATPNTDFKGMTAQVEFMHGKALIAPDELDLALQLEEQFGYTVQFPEGADMPGWAEAKLVTSEKAPDYRKPTEVQAVQRRKKD